MDKIQNTPFDGETFAGTMLEPLFYFAMSRTRDENETSALVSDIAEAVLAALGKGKTPADPGMGMGRCEKPVRPVCEEPDPGKRTDSIHCHGRGRL